MSMNVLISRFSKYISISILFLLIFIFLSTGFIGIDYGYHWDEQNHWRTTIEAIRSGIFLPNRWVQGSLDGFYDYSSIPYWLNLLSVSDEAIKNLFSQSNNFSNIDALADLEPFQLSLRDFVLGSRPIFLIVSSLTGVWLYFSLSKTSKLAAIVAAGIPLLSWEIAYHSRWLAPDVILAQFFALWVMALARAENSAYRLKWVYFAAIAAGLATGTKYTAGVLFVFTILFLLLTESSSFRIKQFPFKKVLRIISLWFITFLITTPGMILQPLDFWADVLRQSRHYATGHATSWGVALQDIYNPWIYLSRLFEYIGLALFSPYAPISLLLFITSILGFIHLCKTKRTTLALTIAITLIFYIFFFSFRTKVFIVRNYLFLLPLFAILIASGIERMFNHSRLTRSFALLLMIATITFNSYFLLTSAFSIPYAKSNDLAPLLVRHIKSHGKESFALSESLQRDLQPEELPNIVQPSEADTFAYRVSEIKIDTREFELIDDVDDLAKLPSTEKDIVLNDYPATRYNTFKWLGPYEVNYNYYPNWRGRDRIILIPMEEADRWGLTSQIASISPFE